MVSVVADTSLVPDSQHQTHICSGEAGQMSPERVQSFRLAKKSHSISKLPHWRPKRGERGRYFFFKYAASASGTCFVGFQSVVVATEWIYRNRERTTRDNIVKQCDFPSDTESRGVCQGGWIGGEFSSCYF